MSFWLAECHQNRRPILFLWLERDSLRKSPCLLVTEPMMLVWSSKLISESVSWEKKANKLLEVLIMLLANSNSWNLLCSSTAEKLTEGIRSWSCTRFTKTFSMSQFNTTLGSGQHFQAKHSTMLSSISYTISLWLPSLSCTMLYLISNMRSLMMAHARSLEMKINSSSWSILFSTS